MDAPGWLTDPLYRNVYETIAKTHLTEVSYGEWIDHWFGRAVISQYYPWFGEMPADHFLPAMANEYALRLFTNSASDLQYLHDDQVGAGLWLLMSEDGIHLAHPDNGIARRDAVLLAITGLFRDLFAKRCVPVLSAGSDQHSVLNGCCYMWWEFFTHIAFPGDPDFGRMMECCWRVMEDTLAIPHIAVKESALHGLGHANHYDAARVAMIIDRWLQANAGADPDLIRYARAARSGCIQ